MIAFLLCLVFLAASTAAVRIAPTSFPKGLMLDGKSLEIEEAPYVAIIQWDDRPICGGAIISSTQILTAAHCVMYKSSPIRYKVRIGSSSRNGTDGKNVMVREIKIHEDFTGAYGSMVDNPHQIPTNDLAMIVTEPMDLNAKSQPIPLIDEAQEVPQNAEALVTGWLRANGTERLVTKTVYVHRTSSCDTDYQSVGGVPAGQICAANPRPKNKNACLGESGGPLVVDGRLAGILSWGNGCVRSVYPHGIYTSIAYYRDWIDNGGVDVYAL